MPRKAQTQAKQSFLEKISSEYNVFQGSTRTPLFELIGEIGEQIFQVHLKKDKSLVYCQTKVNNVKYYPTFPYVESTDPSYDDSLFAQLQDEFLNDYDGIVDVTLNVQLRRLRPDVTQEDMDELATYGSSELAEASWKYLQDGGSITDKAMPVSLYVVDVKWPS